MEIIKPYRFRQDFRCGACCERISPFSLIEERTEKQCTGLYSFQITVANIHKTHFDTFECLQCHKGHSQSVIACAECHKGAQSIQVP
ncbi:cytochrome c3 family protein [Parasutterella sp.]|uniref:cytochrome c3 family protein n=1 Tax=Parasutterella sp. TaxID=2049037 RepID=UPI003AB7445A